MERNHRSGEVGPRRMLLRLGAMAVALGLVIPVTVANADSSQTSEDVANEIVRLQGNADRTAGTLAQAGIEHEDLAAQIAVAQTQVDAKSAQFSALSTQLATLTVDRFMGGSNGAGGLLFGSPIDQLQADALSAAVYDAGATTLDEVEAAQSDLVGAQAALQTLQSQNENVLTTMAAKQDVIAGQLTQLVALKATLVDAEAKQAYARAVARQKAKDEQARADAQAAAARQASAQATASVSSAIASSTTAFVVGAASGSGGTVVPSGSAKPANAPLLAAAPDPASDAAGAAQPDPVVVVASFVCPVMGPVAFGDTWGAARSGGRHHEGVDLMSPYGTPEVAVVSGVATFKPNELGGNTVSLVGDDGNRYYYAHLSSWEGQSRRVSQGEIMGYVGHTGDTAADHLHFEIHPGGGAAVNPYATVRRFC